MQKMNPKMKYGIVALCLLALILISVHTNQAALADWRPSGLIEGLWAGNYQDFAPYDYGEQSGRPYEDRITIQIEIAPSGSVSGTVGQAAFKGCSLILNRNWFERWIDIKTDYVVRGCTLEGRIVEDDLLSHREISMPFNIEEGEMSGSLFEIEKWQYPYPIIPRLQLTRP